MAVRADGATMASLGSKLGVFRSVAGALLGTACGVPPPPSGDGAVITLEPGAPLDRAPAVLRVRIAGAGTEPRSLLLLEGELGTYHVGRLRAGELPTTLSDRRIPAYAWNDATRGELVLAPSVPLDSGSMYSVAALGIGVLGVIAIDSVPLTRYVTRVWPPAGVRAGSPWVFCGSRPDGAVPGVVLEPANVPAAVGEGADTRGTAAERCLRLEVDGRVSGVVVPPPLAAGVVFDPSPGVLGGGEATTGPVTCHAGEARLGTGCATILDDRAVVRSGEPTLFTLELPDHDVVRPMADVGRFVVRGLHPSGTVRVRGAATDLAGTEASFALTWSTLPEQPHVVINEVLANPIGPEPQGEWVELVNDGPARVDLAGFALSDEGGEVILPHAELDPGSFALLVTPGYSPTSSDVPPAPGTPLVRVPRLGRDGLSNSGERLELRSPDGELRSTFPAVAASRPGVSIARRSRDAFDDDRSAFTPSGPSAATPGAENGSSGEASF